MSEITKSCTGSLFSSVYSIIKRLALLLFVSLLIGGIMTSCHSSKSVKRDRHPHPKEEIKVHKPNKRQKKIIDEAYTWLGTPYKYAGQNKGEGTDCSGFVMMVYETAMGEKIPRNSAKQAEFCLDTDADDVDTGDLVFFATGKDPNRVSHVGIVVDNENFIHASSSKGVVVSKFDNPYYRRTFIKFGRVPKLSVDCDDK